MRNRRAVVGFYPLGALSAAILSLLASPASHAQVTPDAQAGAHRPGTDTAANGVPVVNIVAPSAAGVSHNQYRDFNVDRQGLILNNNAAASQTQRAGIIVGNPNYRGGQAARLIVNEVTSTNRSQLRGYTEVAGHAADVIIANPNGISIDGAGFINTPRVTLTTGAPQFGGDGSLAALRATRGDIRIDGQGLDATGNSRLDLIARSVAVNAKVWADQLAVVTGANHVGYADGAIQAVHGDGDMPGVSLDVAAIGGMYANKIRLIGTEAGLGVRSAGELAAQAGDFTLDQHGRIELTGTTVASGQLRLNGSALDNRGALSAAGMAIRAGELANSGTIQSDGALELSSDGALSNTGALRAGSAATLSASAGITNTGTLFSVGPLNLTTAGRLINSGVIAAAGDALLSVGALQSTGTLGAGVASDGTLQGQGALSITSAGALAAQGTQLAAGAMSLHAASLDLRGAQTRAGGDIALTSTAGDVVHAQGNLGSGGQLVVRSAGQFDNSRGAIQAGRLDVQSHAFNNAYGSISQTGSGMLGIRVEGMLDNRHGRLAGNATDITIDAGSLDNRNGTIEQAGNGVLTLRVSDQLDNSEGRIVGNGALALAGNALINRGGTVSVAGAASVTSARLDNTGGLLIAGAIELAIADTFANAAGTVQAAGRLQISAGTLVNADGQLKALGGAMGLRVAHALSNAVGGFIGGNAGVNLTVGQLDNAGQIYASDHLDLTARDALLNRGAIQAQRGADIAAGSLSNDTGRIEAGSGASADTLRITSGAISNRDGRIANAGTGMTQVHSTGTLDNSGGVLGGQGDVTLSAMNIANGGGTLVANRDLQLFAQALSNRAGTVYGARNLTWNNGTATLDNSGGSFGAGGDLQLTLAAMHNDGGDAAANGDVAVQLAQYDGVGQLRAGRNLSLALAGDYLHRVGNVLRANGDFRFDLAGQLTNAGTLESVGALTIQAAGIINQGGALINSATTTLAARGSLLNNGRIEGDDLSLTADEVVNTGTLIGNTITARARMLTNGADLGSATDNTAYQTALIAAVDKIALYVSGTLLNRDALIYSAGDLILAADENGLRSQAIINRSGNIEADGNVTLAAQQIINERRVLDTERHVLSAAEQTANTTISAPWVRYREDDPNPLHHPPYVLPEQMVSADELLVAHGYCVANNWDNRRCIGYPFGDFVNGRPTTFQGITTSIVIAVTRLKAASAESRILAGGDINLSGSLLNSNSTIAAGRNLSVNGQSGSLGEGDQTIGGETVRNIAFTPTAEVTQRNDYQVQYQRLIEDPRHWVDADFVTYRSDNSAATLALGSGQPSWISIDPGQTLTARMTAGEALTIVGAQIDNTNVDAQGNLVVGIGLGANAGGKPVNGSNGPGAQTVGDAEHPIGIIALPGNGLYTVRPGSSSGYLIETDPRFASQAGFLGSNYLMDRLGLNGDQQLKRLGDAFYEQRLVLDQITSLTGRRYLDDNSDAMAQYKALMDAGAETAQQFNLAIGVALTPAQMASLTEDIVWMVSQQVAGETVLVPVVYLSQQTASAVASGASLSGKTIALNASGQLTTTGNIQASQDASLKAGNLLNAGNVTAGGNLSINAAQDVLNAGKLSGGNVAIVAGNNVTSTSDLGAVQLGGVAFTGALSPNRAAHLGVATGGQINAAQTLTVDAGNNLDLDHVAISAGKDMGLSAGNDLNATASTIKAGGNAQLVAGHDINLIADGTTGATGGAHNGVEATTHQVTTISAGGSAVLAAGNDLTGQGANLTAGNALVASAGRDVTFDAVTDKLTQKSQWSEGKKVITEQQSDEALRGSNLSGAQGVVISAGRDLNATAVDVSSSQGDIALAAGRDVNLNAGQENHSWQRDTVTKSSGLLSSSKTTTHDTTQDSLVAGSQLSGNNISIAAGRDLNATAASVVADQAIVLGAGRDVNLSDAHDVHSEQHAAETKKSSVFSTSAKRFGSVDPSQYKRTDNFESTQSTSVGNLLSGDSVTVAAGRNLSATNAQIVGTRDVTLAAGNNLTLDAGKNTYESSQSSKVSRTGLQNNGGFSVLAGNRTLSDSNTVTDVSYTGSTVGSLTGGVILSAGNNVHIRGSDVLSETGTAIVGKNVTIDATVGYTETRYEQKMSQDGINVGIGGAAAGLAQGVYGSVKRGSEVKDDRLKALYAAQAGYMAKDAYDALSANPGLLDGATKTDNQNGVNLKVGIGGASASNRTSTHDEMAYGSSIRSRGDITIAATGGDLNIIGSAIDGNNVALAAANNINLRSQAENHSLQSDNKNGSAGVGVLIGSSGFGIYAEAAMGKGNAHGNGTTHAETTVNANNNLTLVSGNDTNIIGAQLKGNQVIGAIGGNLTIRSEQDTDDYASKQWQAAGQVVIGYSSGGQASYNQSKANSHYQSVNEVSGIQAGSGGFDITVGGNTHLAGGVIGSSADPSKNVLNTGTLTYEAIHNEATYSASSVGVSGGYSAGGGGYGGSGVTGAGSLPISQSGNSSSDTKAGIAHGTIIVRDGTADLSGLDRDPSLDSQALKPIFDQEKIANQQELGQIAGYVGMRTAGTLADEMYKQAVAKGDTVAMAQWAEGGTNKTILHGLVGAGIAALGGGDVVGGTTGAAASQLASGKMLDYLQQQGIDPYSSEGKALMQLASVAVGAAVGGQDGAATALYGEQFNRQLHPSVVHKIRDELAAKYAAEHGIPEDEARSILIRAQLSQEDGWSARMTAGYDSEETRNEALSFLQANGIATGPISEADWNNGGIGAKALTDDKEALSDVMLALNKDGNPLQTKVLYDYFGQQSFDENFKAWWNDETYGFLAFNGQIALSGASAGLVGGGAPWLLSASNGTRVGSALEYILTTRTGTALTNGAVNSASQFLQDGKINPIDAGVAVVTGGLSVGGRLPWNLVLGGSGGVVKVQLNNYFNGRNDSVLLGGLQGALANGVGYWGGSKVTNMIFPNGMPGAIAPVFWGNVIGGSIGEATDGFINDVNKRLGNEKVH